MFTYNCYENINGNIMGWRKLYFLKCLSGREVNIVGRNKTLGMVKGVIVGNLWKHALVMKDVAKLFSKEGVSNYILSKADESSSYFAEWQVHV